MAFAKQAEPVGDTRTKYDPYYDRDILLAFEKEIEPFEYDFDKYAEAKGLTVRYGRYAQYGAISGSKHQEYRDARMKHSGLQYLRHLREQKKNDLDGDVRKAVEVAEKVLKGKIVIHQQ